MNKYEVIRRLREEGFNPYAYAVGMLRPDAHCLRESLGTWSVLWCGADGAPAEEKRFGSEEDACAYFYEAVRRNPLARIGP